VAPATSALIAAIAAFLASIFARLLDGGLRGLLGDLRRRQRRLHLVGLRAAALGGEASIGSRRVGARGGDRNGCERLIAPRRVVARIDPEQEIAGLDGLIVIDVQVHDIPDDLRCEWRDGALDVRVIGGDVGERIQPGVHAIGDRDQRDDGREPGEDSPSHASCGSLWRADGVAETATPRTRASIGEGCAGIRASRDLINAFSSSRECYTMMSRLVLDPHPCVRESVEERSRVLYDQSGPRRTGPRSSPVRPGDRAVLPSRIALLVVCVLAIAACGDRAVRDEAVTLVFKHAKILGPSDPLPRLLREFEARHPGVRVRSESITWNSDEQHQFYAVNLEGGNPGFDVLMLDVVWVPEFGRAGCCSI